MFNKLVVATLLVTSGVFGGSAMAQQSVTVTAGTDDDYLFTSQRFLVSDQRLFHLGIEYANGPFSFAVDDYGKGANEETDYTARFTKTCFGEFTCAASVAYWDTKLEGIIDYTVSIGAGDALWWSAALEFQDGETYQSFIPKLEAGYSWVVPGADWLSLDVSGGIAHDGNSKTLQAIWRAGPTVNAFDISVSAGWYGYVPLNQTDDGSRDSFGVSASWSKKY